MKCNQCGKCCKGIRLDFELDDELKQHFYEIHEKEAFELHPIYILFRDTQKNYKYYNCNKLKDGICSIHESKPQICKDYPSQDGHSIKDINCGYFNKDDEIDMRLAFMSSVLRMQKQP